MKKMATAALSAFFAFMASAETNAPQEMIASYLRLNIANQVAGQAAEIVAPLKEKARAKLLAKVEDYRQGVLATIRERLVAACGDAETAEESFGRFVSTWTTAESENDGEFLAQMSEIAGIDPPESTYNGLKGRILEKFLPDDLAAAGQFLSGLQAQVADKLAKAAEKKLRNPLKGAEAPADTFVEAKDDGVGALRSFGAARKARREKALAEAQAGMAQVAQERSAADQEANARKQAAAQAEAAGMRQLAEAKAAAEAEAAQQAANSWSARLKAIAGTTISAGTGAFAGTVGSRAGQAAADAVFK